MLKVLMFCWSSAPNCSAAMPVVGAANAACCVSSVLDAQRTRLRSGLQQTFVIIPELRNLTMPGRKTARLLAHWAMGWLWLQSICRQQFDAIPISSDLMSTIELRQRVCTFENAVCGQLRATRSLPHPGFSGNVLTRQQRPSLCTMSLTRIAS